jgi:hypothetical protein
MSVPLDRLYHMLDDASGNDILIYRFTPHGSKKLENIRLLKNHQLSWFESMTRPNIIFHDQEPLSYNFYTPDDIWKTFTNESQNCLYRFEMSDYQLLIKKMHLRSRTAYQLNWYDKILLGHSEKNSENLNLYQQNGFIGVYWWSHAVIARDWFRFAEHDQQLLVNFDLFNYDFLIYNRAWTGTREYRLSFANMLIDQQLIKNCKTSFAPIDTGINYVDHQYTNARFKINRTDLENYFDINTTVASASADYDSVDYQQCAVEVVLETLFDDSRLHLTEKSLRPIACGRPFMLVSTPGSLKYLQSYGFKTFGSYIDESYDDIIDPVERLTKIVAEMKRISNLGSKEKTQLWQHLYNIAEYNKQVFFSKKWHDSIVNEYQNNVTSGLEQLQHHKTGMYWKKMLEMLANYPDVKKDFQANIIKNNIVNEINALNGQLGINNKY